MASVSPMSRRLTVLAGLLAVLVAAPGAQAARVVPRGFIGVDADGPAVDGTVPLDGETARMAAAGVETLGTSFDWASAQPDENGPIDYTVTDRVVLSAARKRIRVFPVVIQAPRWARVHPGEQFSPPDSPAAYAAYAGGLVRRYGPGGSFWAEHPDVPTMTIHDWQVWNEPAGADQDDRGSVFWVDPGHPFTTRYIALLRAAHAAIKAADPKARVVLAGLVGQSWETLRIIYNAGARPFFDAVSLHPYTADVSNVVRIVQFVRTLMNKRGDKRKPILVTEVAWPAFDVRSVRKAGRARTQKVQSSWLAAVYRTLIRQRRHFGIQRILWYSWMTRDASRTYAFDYTGLVRLESGNRVTAKPALRSFARVALRYEGRT